MSSAGHPETRIFLYNLYTTFFAFPIPKTDDPGPQRNPEDVTNQMPHQSGIVKWYFAGAPISVPD